MASLMMLVVKITRDWAANDNTSKLKKGKKKFLSGMIRKKENVSVFELGIQNKLYLQRC